MPIEIYSFEYYENLYKIASERFDKADIDAHLSLHALVEARKELTEEWVRKNKLKHGDKILDGTFEGISDSGAWVKIRYKTKKGVPKKQCDFLNISHILENQE